MKILLKQWGETPCIQECATKTFLKKDHNSSHIPLFKCVDMYCIYELKALLIIKASI
jgi:hypothetical protein